jgi:hypothetical protein
MAAGSCAVPAATSTWPSECVPSDWPGALISVTFVTAPPGAWLEWNYKVEWGTPQDPGYDSTVIDEHENDPVAGVTRSLTGINPGRCLRLRGSDGLVYTLTAVPSPPLWDTYQGWPA